MGRKRSVEEFEFREDEFTVLADDAAVEFDFAAAVVRALDADEVPVDLAAVAVVGFALVGLAGGEVEAAGDFLVEEDIAHGVEDLAIEADGEFADVAGSLVGVEDAVDGLGVVSGGLDDFAFGELEADAVEGDALVDGGGVVGDDPFDGVADWGGEAFAVGDVFFAAAGFGLDACDAEAEVGVWAGDVDLVGLVHEFFEGVHAWFEGGVVEEADAEVEVFEGFGAHVVELSHGGIGPAEDAPFGFLDAMVHDRAHFAHDELHAFGGDVGAFGDVVAAADGDVGLHALDEVHLDGAPVVVLGIGGTELEFAGDAGVVDLDLGDATGGAGGADEGDAHFGWGVVEVEEDVFAGFEGDRVGDELGGELVEARVVHGEREERDWREDGV